MKIGERVVWHTGFMAGEQGQAYPSWWPEDRFGTLIRIDVDRDDPALVEMDEGERSWVSFDELESYRAWSDKRNKSVQVDPDVDTGLYSSFGSSGDF